MTTSRNSGVFFLRPPSFACPGSNLGTSPIPHQSPLISLTHFECRNYFLVNNHRQTLIFLLTITIP